MNLPAELFSSGWHWAAVLITLVSAVCLLRSVNWAALVGGVRLNVLSGFAVTLMVAWSMKAGVLPGLNLHLLGAMAATLALGPGLAVVALALALTGITLNGEISLASWPINFVLMCLCPVLFARAISSVMQRVLPAHFFVFVFVVAFFGSALTIVASGVLVSAVLAMAGAYSADLLMSDYLPYFILVGFSEAWISGAVITLMIVYRPEWVAAFDDRKYLLGK